jgi:Uma2 family endonuclease
MAPIAEALKLTYEDYLELPEDGNRHELIDGDHVMTPSPGTLHQRVSMNLSLLIGGFLGRHAVGTLLAAPIDVVLSELDVVQPDLVFVAAARSEIITQQHIAGAPDLVVEILSSTTRRRDEVTKRKLYARFGVREYWVVDPELERIRVLRKGVDELDETDVLSAEAGSSLATDLLPGLEIAVADVFPS